MSCVLLLLALLPTSSGEESKPHESKKGLQVQMVDDALALGVKHAAINVNLAQLVEPADSQHTDVQTVDGTAYAFNRGYEEYLDARVLPFLAHGANVYLIILLYVPPPGTAGPALKLVHPHYLRGAPNRICAFNVSDAEGTKWLRAAATALARRYAAGRGARVHFIIGNEVNSHFYWYNMGLAPLADVVRDYEKAVRIWVQAVAAVAPESRVFVSLDHNWARGGATGEPLKNFGAHGFLDAFCEAARENGDYDWHVAFHPYTESLFETRFWEGQQSPHSVDAPMITFNNAEVLNEFMKRQKMLHNGKVRRIIFSEQGFHTADGPDGEKLQAAAYAYAYRKTEALDGVDAFILHRHVDNLHEGGLRLGLWTCDASGKALRKKMIYEVFKKADTPEWRAAFEFALPVVGIKEWP